MVTHDPVAAAHADAVVFLADGRVVDGMDDPTRAARPRPTQGIRRLTCCRLTLASLWARRRRVARDLVGRRDRRRVPDRHADPRRHDQRQLRPALRARCRPTPTSSCATPPSTSDEPDATRGLDRRVAARRRCDDVDGVQHAEAQVVGYGTLLGARRRADRWERSAAPGGELDHRSRAEPVSTRRRGARPGTDREVVVNRGAAEAGRPPCRRHDDRADARPDPGHASSGSRRSATPTASARRRSPRSRSRGPGERHDEPGQVSTDPREGGQPGVSSDRAAASHRRRRFRAASRRSPVGSSPTSGSTSSRFLDILRARCSSSSPASRWSSRRSRSTTPSRSRSRSEPASSPLLRAVGASRRQVRGSVVARGTQRSGWWRRWSASSAGFGVATGVEGDVRRVRRRAAGRRASPFGRWRSGSASRWACWWLRRRAAAGPEGGGDLPRRRSPGAGARAAGRPRPTRATVGAGLLVAGAAVGIVAALGGGPVVAAVAAAVLLVAGTFVVAPALVRPGGERVRCACSHGVARRQRALRGPERARGTPGARRRPRPCWSSAIAVVSLITVLVGVVEGHRSTPTSTTVVRCRPRRQHRVLRRQPAQSPRGRRPPRVCRRSSRRSGWPRRRCCSTATPRRSPPSTAPTSTGHVGARARRVAPARSGTRAIAIDRGQRRRRALGGRHDARPRRSRRLDRTGHGAARSTSRTRCSATSCCPPTLLARAHRPADAPPCVRDHDARHHAAEARRAIAPIARALRSVRSRTASSTPTPRPVDSTSCSASCTCCSRWRSSSRCSASPTPCRWRSTNGGARSGCCGVIGETRRQVRSTLRLESVILSGFGTILGLALGGVPRLDAVRRRVRRRHVQPPGRRAARDRGGGSPSPAWSAAWRPARRASRVPILDAIGTT